MWAGRFFNHVVLWTLVAAISLPSAPATAAGALDKWSRVTALKSDVRVVVRLGDEETVDGWFVSAGASGLTVHVIGHDVVLPRDRVHRVAIVKDGRPWYAIPVAAAAAAGGLAVTVGILLGVGRQCRSGAVDSVCTLDADESPWFFLLFAIPVVAGAWAYSKIERKPLLKVIYQAPEATRHPPDPNN